MDEEQRAWQKQLEANFGPREFLRFSAALIVWQFLGVGLGVLVRSAVPSVLSLVTFVAFAVVATRWKPAYWLLRKIMGNKNLPGGPRPPARAQGPTWRRPWWGYLPGIFGWILTLIVLYLAIRYFLK